MGRPGAAPTHVLTAPSFDCLQVAFQAVSHLNGFSVLEVGCHSATYAHEFLHAGARRVVTFDVAPARIMPGQQVQQQAEAGGAHQYLDGDLLEGAVSDTFDVVVALDAFGWVAQDPAILLARMREVASEKVIARFPAGAALSERVRRLWSREAGRSYTGRQVRSIAHQAGLPNFRIEKLHEDGYILIATPRGRRAAAAPRLT
jgi:hypothetical protein